MQKLDRLGWAGTISVGFDDLVLGIRAHPEHAVDRLRRALAAYVVDEEEAAPPNYSLRLGDASEESRTARPLNVLHQSITPMIRTLSPARAYDTLFHLLSGYVEQHRDDVVVMRGRALIKDGQAIIVPGGFTVFLAARLAMLQRHGIRIVPGSVMKISLDTGELVVEPHALEVDDSALADLVDSRGADREPEEVAPGRYPVTAWTVAFDDGKHEPVSPNQLLTSVLPLVINRDRLEPQTLVDALAASISGAACTSIWIGEHMPTLLDQLDALVENR